MGTIDFILNLAAVLLWLNWRSSKADPLVRRRPATLMGTLRPATAPAARRWRWLLLIPALLAGRAWVYWQFGASTIPVWAGKADFGIVVLSISCHSTWAGFWRMMVFSGLSFSLMLGVFYLWLLLLSLLKGPDPIHGLVRVGLGRVDDWPTWAKVVVPWLVTAGGWLALTWLLAWQGIIPPPVSMAQRIEQGVLIATGAFLVWKYLLGALFVLYLLNTYVYLGNSPFWKYVYLTAQKALGPLAQLPLRSGKMDFAPVAGTALVFLAAEGMTRGLDWLFIRLPL